MLTPDLLRTGFAAGVEYTVYAATGAPHHQATWRSAHDRIVLTPVQTATIAAFTRRLNILAISGIWCGDCSAQLPILDHVVRANARALSLRFVDRDEHAGLAERVRICGGLRVPTVLFLNEEFEFLSLYGDRSLARMRAIARRSLGAACDVPGSLPAGDDAAATVQDWVNEVERAHLIARLSPKLRERHAD